MRVAGAFTWTNAGGGSTAVYYSRQLLRCLRGITKARLRQHVSRGEDDVVDGNAARARRGEGDVSDGRKKPGRRKPGEVGKLSLGLPRRGRARSRARLRDAAIPIAAAHPRTQRSPAASRSGRGRPEASPATPSIGPGPRAPETGRGGADHRRSIDGNECATTSGRERGGTLTR